MKKYKLNNLHKKAEDARKNAYAPYSELKVGAALQVEKGKIFTGCNIENASFGLTMCAERVAVFKAVSAGYCNFEVIYIIADTKNPISPCGACRQVLSEFDPEVNIIMSNLNRDRKMVTAEELLPFSFEKGDL
ncbi:MAG: cytidine deaminase [Bacillota bacterium]